jgi:hypothetical protein
MSNDGAVSEFIDKVLQNIFKIFYAGLYESTERSLEGLFDSFNREVNKATNLISAGPKQWNTSAYSMMQSVSENVCIPIAAVFITVIFCWELIHLVQESNSMHNIPPERLMIVLLKFALCLVVCAYSFKIVMSFCDLGIWASAKLGGHTSTSLWNFQLTLEDMGIDPTPEKITFSAVMELAGYKVMLAIGTVGIWICGAIVYVRVMLWFIELLLYASPAPIPYSTWMNKEWSQMGMNYTRKMLALSFEGFFMLLLFAVYGGVLEGLQTGDFKQNLVMIIGCGFGLAVMMFKVGNISASIFNAH